MAKTCPVCRSVFKESIEWDLLAGEDYNVVERRWRIDRIDLERHVRRHRDSLDDARRWVRHNLNFQLRVRLMRFISQMLDSKRLVGLVKSASDFVRIVEAVGELQKVESETTMSKGGKEPSGETILQFFMSQQQAPGLQETLKYNALPAKLKQVSDQDVNRGFVNQPGSTPDGDESPPAQLPLGR